MQQQQVRTRNRLEGLDIARYLAFVGMVIVNFRIAMGADGDTGLWADLSNLLQGRAAATFVVLAGIGLGLAGLRNMGQTMSVTLKRAAFLLVIGLLNMLIFDADILHYYAIYFLFGAFLMPLSTRMLVAVVIGVNVVFLALLLTLDYELGWNWEDFSYSGFWTPAGFLRNLFFNGWHPVFPWLGFLVFGLILSRLDLGTRAVQLRLILAGGAALALAEGLSAGLLALAGTQDPDMQALLGTAPIPPMPLYVLAGIGAASLVTGLCLMVAPALQAAGVMAALAPAGRQTLTLYIAHILLGMGALEAMGLLGGRSAGEAVLAALIFCALATLYALLWARWFKRGPVEALMRRVAG